MNTEKEQFGGYEFRVPCDVCGVTFKKLAYLKAHRKKYHTGTRIENKADWDSDSEIDDEKNYEHDNVKTAEELQNLRTVKMSFEEQLFQKQSAAKHFVPKRKNPPQPKVPGMYKKPKIQQQPEGETSQLQKKNEDRQVPVIKWKLEYVVKTEKAERKTDELSIFGDGGEKAYSSLQTVKEKKKKEKSSINLGDYLPTNSRISPRSINITRHVSDEISKIEIEIIPDTGVNLATEKTFYD